MSLGRTDLSFLLDELQYGSVNGTTVSGGQMVPHSFAHPPSHLRGLLSSPVCTDAMGIEKVEKGKAERPS